MHRISRGIHIRFRLNFILGIGDFRHAVLTTTKKFSTKTQKLKLVKIRFEFYEKNAVPYKFQNFEKSFFERFISIFALPLTTASRKHVNPGGRSPNAAPPKTGHLWALLNK